MKNIVFKLLLLNCTLISLSSCLAIEKRTNFIVPGEFYGENLGVTFYLNINKISRDDFDAADGLNVLEDFANPNNYYSIDFYYIDDDDNKLGALRIERTKKIMESTDIALLVFDASLKNEDYSLELKWKNELISLEIPVIAVLNKIDLNNDYKNTEENIKEIFNL